MRKIYRLAKIDEELCNGDKICENICVTRAVKVVDRKAVVDADRCVSCENCLDACPTGAIKMGPRENPLLLGTNPDEVSLEELTNLCARAFLEPEEMLCVCTRTTAKEVAAAILKGAKTPEDVTLKTGIRSACGMWCINPIMRLLEAHGVDLPESDNYRWYKIKTNIWNISKEAALKFPEYRVKQDLELFEEGIFHSMLRS